MILSDPVILQPYEVYMYCVSSESPKEDKKCDRLFDSASEKLGIDSAFQEDSERTYEAACCDGFKDGKHNIIIYIRNKKINRTTLDHELIHALNMVNYQYNVSCKPGHDESCAYFFEYMKNEFIKLLDKYQIQIIQ